MIDGLKSEVETIRYDQEKFVRLVG